MGKQFGKRIRNGNRVSIRLVAKNIVKSVPHRHQQMIISIIHQLRYAGQQIQYFVPADRLPYSLASPADEIHSVATSV